MGGEVFRAQVAGGVGGGGGQEGSSRGITLHKSYSRTDDERKRARAGLVAECSTVWLRETRALLRRKSKPTITASFKKKVEKGGNYEASLPAGARRSLCAHPQEREAGRKKSVGDHHSVIM